MTFSQQGKEGVRVKAPYGHPQMSAFHLACVWKSGFLPFPNVGLLLRRCSGKGLHLAMAGEPRGFTRVAAGFSSYDGEFRLPLVLAQASPIFHSSCEGKLGIALE